LLLIVKIYLLSSVLTSTLASSTATYESAESQCPALASAAIPAPLVLGEGPRSQVLLSIVHPKAGDVRIQSQSASKPAHAFTIHLVAKICQLLEPAHPLTSAVPSVFNKLLTTPTMISPTPVALAAVASPLQGSCQPTSFRVHPALLDNCTQVGSAFSPSEKARTFRVPVGAALYTPIGSQGVYPHNASWGIAAFVGSDVASNVTCSFSLNVGNRVTFALADLLFKPLSRAIVDGSTSGGSVPAPAVLYRLNWLVNVALQSSSAARPGLTQASLKEPAIWSSGVCGKLRIGLNASPILAAARSLQYLQGVHGKGHVTLTTPAQLCDHTEITWASRAYNNQLASATAAAMLRVAAQEKTAIQWHHQACDVNMSSPMVSFEEDADAFGVCYSRQSSQVPRLVDCPEATPLTGTHHMKGVTWGNGTVLVVGGLGDIGKVICSYVAISGNNNIAILTRSAHEAAIDADVNGLITISSCNAGVARDVSHLQSGLQWCQTPVTGAIHAGGVLEDGLIGKQTVATLRRVMTPKLIAGQRICAATSSMPVTELGLFSSLSGFLGTAGQVNYSAGNAALDQLSCNLQSQGNDGILLTLR
jgi:KR domain